MTKRSVWIALRASLWFIPLWSLLLAVICAHVLVQFDLYFTKENEQAWPDFLRSGTDSARQILSTIASSMITVAGVVFSVTIVSLALASNQYSPRVLRNFMRDRLNQLVFGVFVGVFIYCLLVLRAVGTQAESFVPHVALWIGILLAIASICFLIAFIHHTATSIQASEILSDITKDTLKAILSIGQISTESETATETYIPENMMWTAVPSCKTGYVQDVEVKELFDLACLHKIVLRVELGVGDFIIDGRPLVAIGGHYEPDKKLTNKIQGLFAINTYRSIEQDPMFGVREIVDIALRALSSGIDDATTAVNCVDYLGAILHAAIQVKPAPDVRTHRGEARLVFRQFLPKHIVDVALNEIRQNASHNVAVLLRLLRVVRQLLEKVADPKLRTHLCQHAYLIREEAERGVPSAHDRAQVEMALERVLTVYRK